ncbi:ABC transporter ATP-binding protein [Teichococcus vastitatis]|uniref:ABC transporter ATP-binding protein n=1 Tax=Teichococcus vastitatis TaxID=2307076 RepID=A0ABS9W8R9_9PROT|nr:ABC transporter ATP-binding protein [Pseudoroseomonas vastitatis]MCI0755160.1 ABC transporter ATP-binding protein [Pseudoroseomonas vastitatis]
MRLSVRGFSLRYGVRVAVDRVDLQANPGEVLAILGANGSGKSSLLRGLAGVQRHAGTVEWSGGEPGRVGYMPQDTSARSQLTAFEVVLLGRLRSLAFKVDVADLKAARDTLEEVGISHLAERPIRELSGGQRQLVFLAQVLSAGPSALLLDEPTSALDITHQLRVLALLRSATHSRRLTTIVVLHDLNAAARFADRIVMMHDGRVAGHGTPAEALTAETLRRCYGVEVAVFSGPDGAPVILPLRPCDADAAP